MVQLQAEQVAAAAVAAAAALGSGPQQWGASAGEAC